MQIFYTPQIATSCEFPDEEAAHCVRVLRLTEGAEVLLTDGRGSFYRAVLTQAHPKHCTFEIVEQWQPAPLWNFHLHIAIAPTKNIDRTEWFVEKATEIGIDAITCLNCRFSERKEVKPARLEKILISAMKQSQKATLPQLEGMVGFAEFVRRPFEGRKFIAHCEEGEKPLLHLDTHTNPECGAGIYIQLSLQDYFDQVQETAEKEMQKITLQDILDRYQEKLSQL